MSVRGIIFLLLVCFDILAISLVVASSMHVDDYMRKQSDKMELNIFFRDDAGKIYRVASRSKCDGTLVLRIERMSETGEWEEAREPTAKSFSIGVKTEIGTLFEEDHRRCLQRHQVPLRRDGERGRSMTSFQDLVNGMFEFFSGMFLWRNVYLLARDKTVRGVSVLSTSVFAAWGVWNLYYYPFLGQWISFLGGLNICIANFFWVFLAVLYSRKDRSSKNL